MPVPHNEVNTQCLIMTLLVYDVMLLLRSSFLLRRTNVPHAILAGSF